MLKLSVGLVVGLWASMAVAADQPVYAPPAAWVKPLTIPEPSATEGAIAVQVLLAIFRITLALMATTATRKLPNAFKHRRGCRALGTSS